MLLIAEKWAEKTQVSIAEGQGHCPHQQFICPQVEHLLHIAQSRHLCGM